MKRGQSTPAGVMTAGGRASRLSPESLAPSSRVGAAASCQSGAGKSRHLPQKAPLRPWPKGAGNSFARPPAAGLIGRKQGSDREVRRHRPTFQTLSTGVPEPSAATPTPTSWKPDDCHRTFRPMRKRHHSVSSGLSRRGRASASGAPAAAFLHCVEMVY